MVGNIIHTETTRLYVQDRASHMQTMELPSCASVQGTVIYSHFADHETVPPIVEGSRRHDDEQSFRSFTALIVLPRGKRDR